MSEGLQVIITHTKGDKKVDQIFEWTLARWRVLLPSTLVTVVPGDSDDKVVRVDLVRDTLLFADDTVTFDPYWVVEAYRQISAGEADSLVPRYHDLLTPEYTAWVLEQDPALIIEPTHMDMDWTDEGRLVMVSRAMYGFDPRQKVLKGSAWQLNLA